jgi:hypothetical protein
MDLFDLYQARQIADAGAQAGRAHSRADSAHEEIGALRRRLDRLVLVNTALWELLKERHGLIDAELQAKILEIDAADGVVDGRAAGRGAACAACGKRLHPKHARCLYCGHEHAPTSPVAGV